MSSQFVLPDGTPVALGNNDIPSGIVGAWNVYGSVPSTPVYPRSQWKQYASPDGFDPNLPPRHNQSSLSCCNASAICAGVERRRKVQGQDKYVALSAGYLYGLINGGVDQGSTLEAGMARITDPRGGTCSVATVPYLDWHSRPAAAAIEARKYVVLEAWLCPTFDHFVSAIIAGFDAISGIPWYQGWMSGGDKDGWLSWTSRGRAVGGHATLSYALAERGGKYGVWNANSWTERWNPAFKGCAVFPEEAYARTVGGLWAIRVVSDEGGTLPTPKVS